MAGALIEEHEQWLQEYFAAEADPPAPAPVALRVVPVVDFQPALDQPTKQLLIVSHEAVRALVAPVLQGVACISWGSAGTLVDLAPLLAREGRRVFVWLHNPHVRAWLSERLDALGYAVEVLPPLEDDALVPLCADWPTLRAWVTQSKTRWMPTPTPEDVPDILPADAPGEPLDGPEPDSNPKVAATPRRALRQAQEELERLALERQIDLGLRTYTIDDWMGIGLHITAGKPTANTSNIALLFDHIGLEVWYDDFLQSLMTATGDRAGSRRWTDADDIRTTIAVQRQYGITGAHKTIVSDAVIEYGMRKTRHCLRKYIADLEWDGVSRLYCVLEDLFGVEPSLYHSEVGQNFFKSLVARALWPGCKVDTMPVFEGRQGIGKSSVIEALGGDWYMVMTESPEKKDFYVSMAGKWIIEIAELDAFSRADVRSVKRALSTAIDRYRSPYGRHAEDHSRQCVFAGSCNSDDWNGDPTGARRFWPVACKSARPDLARMNRDQYFAEAKHLLLMEGDHPDWWTFQSQAEVRKEQESRFVDDDWTSAIALTLRGRSSVTPDELYRCLGLEPRDWTKSNQMRIASMMKRLGWQAKNKWDGEARIARRTYFRLVSEDEAGEAAGPAS